MFTGTQAGRHEQAVAVAAAVEQTARSITDPGEQAYALARVAGALATAGRHEQAEQTARSITSPFPRMDALVAVVGALVQAGRHEQAVAVAAGAEQTARSITDPDRQAEALARVAGALATAGEHRAARRMAAAACAAGRWTIAVKLVLQLDRAAVELAPLLLGDHVTITIVHETP